MSPIATASRRGFLKATGFLGTGIAVSFATGCSLLPPIPKNPVPEVKDGLGWISLTPEGKWQLWSPRMEMGQNILGSLQQIAAVELGVPAAQITVALPSTSQIGRVNGGQRQHSGSQYAACASVLHVAGRRDGACCSAPGYGCNAADI